MEAAAPLAGQLRLAVLRLSRRLRQQAVGEITPSQLSALASIAKHGELSLGALASIERIAPPSMTRIAANLEAQGLVVRRSDDVDRRVARVAISDSGRAVLDEIRNRRDAYLAVRIRDLSEEDRDLLAKAIPILELLAAEGAGLEVEPVTT
jgi:DNA-binding MarR family transcriptional regulator